MDLPLSPGAHLQWRCPCDLELQVRSGRLWLTIAGHPEDHFLAPGDGLWLAAGDVLTLGVEGEGPLQLQWQTLPADPAGWRARALQLREAAKQRAWQGFVAALRRWRRGLRYRVPVISP